MLFVSHLAVQLDFPRVRRTFGQRHNRTDPTSLDKPARKLAPGRKASMISAVSTDAILHRCWRKIAIALTPPESAVTLRVVAKNGNWNLTSGSSHFWCRRRLRAAS